MHGDLTKRTEKFLKGTQMSSPKKAKAGVTIFFSFVFFSFLFVLLFLFFSFIFFSFKKFIRAIESLIDRFLEFFHSGTERGVLFFFHPAQG